MSYNFYFAAIAILAFWAFYQTLDVNTASTMMSASVELQQESTTDWIVDKRNWVNSHVSPIVQIGSDFARGMRLDF